MARGGVVRVVAGALPLRDAVQRARRDVGGHAVSGSASARLPELAFCDVLSAVRQQVSPGQVSKPSTADAALKNTRALSPQRSRPHTICARLPLGTRSCAERTRCSRAQCSFAHCSASVVYTYRQISPKFCTYSIHTGKFLGNFRALRAQANFGSNLAKSLAKPKRAHSAIHPACSCTIKEFSGTIKGTPSLTHSGGMTSSVQFGCLYFCALSTVAAD